MNTSHAALRLSLLSLFALSAAQGCAPVDDAAASSADRAPADTTLGSPFAASLPRAAVRSVY